MPIWDSVHRGFEKASQETARIAKVQRLRFSIDGLSRQANTQRSNLIGKAMELFATGQLTQSELHPLCQELANLQQQISNTQNELKQLQASQPASSTGQLEAPATYPPTTMPSTMPYTMEGSSELAPTIYAPPPPGHQTYIDDAANTLAAPPPPPPGVEPLTISAMGTVLMSPNPPTPSIPQAVCPACRAELHLAHAFCHNCGMPVQDNDSLQLPTMRANSSESASLGGDETARAE